MMPAWVFFLIYIFSLLVLVRSCFPSLGPVLPGVVSFSPVVISRGTKTTKLILGQQRGILKPLSEMDDMAMTGQLTFMSPNLFIGVLLKYNS